MQIDVCLDYQDEEDRKGISLMGYKENAKFDKPMAGIAGNVHPKRPDGHARVTTPRQLRSTAPGGGGGALGARTGRMNMQAKDYSSSVNLDRNCLSCSGSPSVIFSAFKMACLAYTPSLLDYRGESYNRQQLIELRSKMIKSCWSKIKRKEPWPRVMQGIVAELDEPFLPMIHIPTSNHENLEEEQQQEAEKKEKPLKREKMESSKSESTLKLNLDFGNGDDSKRLLGATGGAKTSRLGQNKAYF